MDKLLELTAECKIFFMEIKQKHNINKVANELRLRALKMALDSGKNGSHLGGGLSTIEIFATLYSSILNFDNKNVTNSDRDRLIVSKGHCVLAYYTALNRYGFISDDELLTFEINGSNFHGHATRNLINGIEFSGGSLGLGVSYAIGVAIAGKINKKDYKVYVIVGDGECNEGIVWEALMSASHFKLDNLVVIVDDNKLQYDGESEKVLNMGSLESKFNSFGFKTYNINGHDVEELYESFLAINNEGKPKAIIANTIKGKGVSYMENKKEWHHSRLSQEQYEVALSELNNVNNS
jgi:transketolase